jgi:hypothetical protein
MQPPVLWGDETVVRERLGEYVSDIRTTRRAVSLDYPFSPRQTVEFFREYFGPTKTAFARLDAGGQTKYASDLERLWNEHNEGDSSRTKLSAEYLEVIARRA